MALLIILGVSVSSWLYRNGAIKGQMIESWYNLPAKDNSAIHPAER